MLYTLLLSTALINKRKTILRSGLIWSVSSCLIVFDNKLIIDYMCILIRLISRSHFFASSFAGDEELGCDD